MERGQKVMCNGYEGTITKVCDGQLSGMVEVRLERGDVCVDASELKRFDNPPVKFVGMDGDLAVYRGRDLSL